MLRLIEFLAARCFLMVLQALPYDASIRVARSIARLAYRFDSTPKRRTLEHLRLAYGNALDPGRTDRIALGVFESMLRHAAEAAHVFRRPLLRTRFENPELFREAYDRGRGVVVVSAHIGCFIRMVSIPRAFGTRSAVIMKKQKNQVLHQWGIRELKRRFNLDVILKTRARDQVGEFLGSGGVVAFFADQHPRGGGHATRFFGREVETAAGPTVYAKRFDCPILVFTATLASDGTHVLRFDGPVSREGSPQEITQRWVDLLEARIREHPEQWMWMHRRWREEPPGSPGQDSPGPGPQETVADPDPG